MIYNSHKIVLLILLIFVTDVSYSQVQQVWVARANGIENKNETATSIAVDQLGYVYVAGARSGTAEDDKSGFLTVKYNPLNGHVMWAHINNGEGGGNARPKAIAVDGAGNVYLTGSSGATSVGQKYFTIKYNTNGILQWEDSYTNSASGEFGNAIAVDGSGNVYVTGFSTTDDGFWAIGTIKYDAAGNRKWVRHYKSDSKTNDNISGIGIAAVGTNIYVVGYKHYSETGRDIIILKYNTIGDFIASNRYDYPGSETPNKIYVDASGNIYITGSTFNNGNNDCITLKYNSNVEFVWDAFYRGTAGEDDVAEDITVDNLGNVFITGFTVPSSTDRFKRDYLTIKYNSLGVQQWALTYTGQGNNSAAACAIVNDALGNVYVTGTSGNGNFSTSKYNYVTLKYNTNGVQQWLIEYDGPEGFRDEAADIVLDLDGNVYVTGNSFRETTLYDMATIKYTQCELTCPLNITIDNDPGKCDAVVNFNPATYTGSCGNTFTYSHNTGDAFPVGITTVTATSGETGATCTFTITVRDIEIPVISCPVDKTVNTDPGVCFATAASVNAGTATATDNCSASVAGIRSDGLLLTDNYPVGITTITWTATDASNNSETCTQTITVEDKEPPVISNASVSKSVLAPPNHKMVDVYVNYTVTDNCSATASLSVTSNEPESGLSNGDKSPDWIIIDNNHVQLRAERAGKGDGRIYTITITATDESGNTSTEIRNVIVAHNIGSPHSGKAVKVGSTVNFTGTFWDVPGNKHTAKWLIDEKISVTGNVSEPVGMKNGTVTGAYKFTSAGVYKLKMNITDQKGVTTTTNTNGDLQATVVIYDPNGGYTFGGGYFISPAGALRKNPSATGNASFGFSINYYKSATNPKGETQFDFKVGELEFNALNFEYLTISGARAQFRGTGKITGDQSGYGFIMTVIDGDLDGTGIDKIRMRIFNRNTGAVIYDTQPGMSEAADPVLSVGENSVVTISNNSPVTRSIPLNTELEVLSKSDLIIAPNPSNTYFSLSPGNRINERSIMQVFDIYGRLLESRFITSHQIISFGHTYRPGQYMVRIVSGTEVQTLKIIKMKN